MFDDVSLQKSLQNLQDASDDLMMLDDDALLVPYQIGEVFISHTQEETQEMLEAAKVSSKMPHYLIIHFGLWRLLSCGLVSWIYMLSFSTIKCVIPTCVCVLSCLQEALEQEARAIELRVSDIQQVLGDLKVHLYAKFGDNINLEADES